MNPVIAKCEAFLGQEGDLLPVRLGGMGSPHANTLSLNDDDLCCSNYHTRMADMAGMEASPSVAMPIIFSQRMLPPCG